MCLAIPGKVIEWLEREPPFTQATVEFAGLRRRVWMACVEHVQPGDYVLVHAGVAITAIDPAEAERTLASLAQAEIVEEIGSQDELQAGP